MMKNCYYKPMYLYSSFSKNMRVSVPTTTIYEQTCAFREGYGTMVGAWHCRCLPCGFKYRLVQDAHVSPLSILGHCFEEQGENEYLVRQRRQCVQLVQCAEMAAGLYALHRVEMAHERTAPMSRG